MLISDDKQFIFIHVEKTAGTSIHKALASYCVDHPSSLRNSVLRTWGAPKHYHLYKFPTHCSAAEAQRRIPSEQFNRYFKFAFVRNPWDRLVSDYNAAIKKDRRTRHKKIKAMSGFAEYVDYEIRRNKLQQHRMLYDKDERLLVDKVGRFENVTSDYTDICAHLDITAPLKQFNAYAHKEYQTYYTDELRDKVAAHWAKDIALFKYTF